MIEIFSLPSIFALPHKVLKGKEKDLLVWDPGSGGRVPAKCKALVQSPVLKLKKKSF
jgi:hypothetical protein